MHNLCSLLSHTYRQVKVLGITFFLAIPGHTVGVGNILFCFFDDIFYNMNSVHCTAVRWIISHHSWFSLKGCPICNGNVPKAFSKQITASNNFKLEKSLKS